jgi:hypothetical protein
MRFQPTVFRPTFGRVLTVVMTALAAAGVIGFVVTGDFAGLARSGWWLLLMAYGTAVLFWFPRVDLGVEEVEVRNPFVTWHVPWTAIQLIDTKWALTIRAGGRRIEAWAAPAGSRWTPMTLGRDDLRVSESAHVAGSIRPGDALNTDSGAAANVMRRHWEELRDDGLLRPEDPASQPRRTVHTGEIAAVAGLIALCVLGLAL